MKCHACGFVSFDYLSECRSCGGDLSSVREKLGFAGTKPAAMPFFLGALLNEYQGGTAAPVKDAVRMDLTGAVIPEIEFGEEFEIEDEPLELDAPSISPAKPASTMKPLPSVSDLIDESMMIDLSDEELSQIMEDQGPEKAIDLNLDMLLGGEASSVDDSPASAASTKRNNGGSSNAQSRVAETPGDDLFTLELTDDDLNQFAHEPDPFEMPKAHEAGPAFGTPSTPLSSGMAPGEAMGVPQMDGADTVLELSDDDLHNMILELDETGVKKDKHMDV